MLSKAMVEKDAIRAALLEAKQAADEKAAAEAAADQGPPAAEDAAAE